MKEIWKPIRGYEGLYEVSNTGEIKSLKRKANNNRILQERKLKLAKSTSGYLYCIIHKKGERKILYIHQAVWDAFGDRPRNKTKLQIDHIDGNQQNKDLIGE